MRSINAVLLEEGMMRRTDDGASTEEDKDKLMTTNKDKEEGIPIILPAPSAPLEEVSVATASVGGLIDLHHADGHNRKGKLDSNSHSAAYSGGYTSIPSAPTPMALSGSNLQSPLSQQHHQHLMSLLYAQHQAPSAALGAYQSHHQIKHQHQQQVVYLQPIIYQPLLTEMQGGLPTAPTTAVNGAMGHGVRMPASSPHIRRTTSTQTLYHRT